jgi:ssDNA-binding Zn-finger/Zn-ribbon topoisomerase 1
VNKERIESLTAAHEAHMKAWKSQKKPTTHVPCPSCKQMIEHKRPRKGSDEEWGSLSTCPYCLYLYYYSITSSDFTVIGLDQLEATAAMEDKEKRDCERTRGIQ